MSATEVVDSVGSAKSSGFYERTAAPPGEASSTIKLGRINDEELHAISPRDDPGDVKLEDEFPPFDPEVEIIRLEMLYGVQAGPSRRRAPRKKKVYPDPHGSTLSTETSLADLRAVFWISEGVEFLLLSPTDRAESPLSGYFTVYESYFSLSDLWFPIPELILRIFRLLCSSCPMQSHLIAFHSFPFCLISSCP
ncbi:unnamed protein product [Microthlaspi erraticum]|uniref:Uncharacterized protein n=1 Tax=Microthlaspi erraticum TaxID=1685480 RepID=A0A6D2LBV9_9BRAS|nr:unnamed protein product [Microthlaspi erraticum]